MSGAPQPSTPKPSAPKSSAPKSSAPKSFAPLPLVLALAIGTAGGWAAFEMRLPLPWMIGAMGATTLAALAGVRIQVPMNLRGVMVALLGVMLGSGFTPEILARMGEWAASLAAMLAYTVVASALGLVYFRRVARFDPITAYFCATPGGLSEMTVVGDAMGGDGRLIPLVHSSRLLLVVLLLPFAYEILLGVDLGQRPPPGQPLLTVAPSDIALLAACGLAGWLGARAIRLPAALIVGPMALSAAVHLAGWTEATPPVELVAAAQIVIGAAIGARFAGASPALVGRTALIGAGATALLVGVAVVFALLMQAATGLPLPALILAYAPGGLAEMSLIALALSLDAAFVATHHIVRIALIVTLAPAVLRLQERLRARD